MSHIAIDYPDEVVHWFKSYPLSEQQRRPIGECTHTCSHRGTTVVGWGPDLQHYELIICDSSSGECKGDCRGWCAAPGSPREIAATDWKKLS